MGNSVPSWIPVGLFVVALALAPAGMAAEFDVVVNGGRVMDPESGLDAVRSLGVREGKIVAVSLQPLVGKETIDASGRVVAPGFIDIHVHGQHARGYDFMARDGVTTALDLEAGVKDFEAFVKKRRGKARIHYGAAAGHIGSRVYVKHGLSTGHMLSDSVDGGFRSWLVKLVQRWVRPTAWIHEPADATEVIRILRSIRDELDAGAIGIGMGLGYTPGARPEEVHAVFELAASRGVPCFVHIEDRARVGDLGPIDRIIDHARSTGASLHVVHVNSSALAAIDDYLARIEGARAEGLDVTTEVYPYTAASTLIESALFDEGFRERRGIDYGDLQWVATGERLTEETFYAYRAQGGTVIMHMMQPAWIERAIAHPLTMIASDGMPMVAGAHPRGAGTHARVLAVYVRQKGTLSLMDSLAKMSLMPARRLEKFVPAMADKGRIRVGADADLAIFDPDTVTDRATFEDSLQYSEGIDHVLVAGTVVVRNGSLVDGVAPGQAVLAHRSVGQPK